MKNKRSVKGAKAAKNYSGKTVAKKGVTAKTRTGGATITEGFLKVPVALQKTLTAKAAADTKFTGKNWQRYALNHLKAIASIEK